MEGYDFASSSEPSVIESHVFAQSTPRADLEREVEIKKQISAPSYFYSLRDNSAPPFRKPGRDKRPSILVGTIMNASEAVQLIEKINEHKLNKSWMNFVLENFIIKKKLAQMDNLTEKKFLVSLLRETIDYGAIHDFNELKLSSTVTIYMSTHLFFKSYYWRQPASVWNYFKELMMRHTSQDSADAEEVFQPLDCYDIMSHFHTIYLSNLPLIHILTFGVHKIKFTWPFLKIVK